MPEAMPEIINGGGFRALAQQRRERAIKKRIVLFLVILAVVSLGLGLRVIANDALRVIWPNGGQKLDSGEWYQLQWHDSRDEPEEWVEIDVITPDPYGVILGPLTVPSEEDGRYLWYIPDNTDEPRCLFRVRDTTGENEDESDGIFGILP